MSERDIDVTSPDWIDGFQTASAENCFNEQHEITRLQSELDAAKRAIGEWMKVVEETVLRYDELLRDVEPVLRAAEGCLRVARPYALGEVDMALQRHLAVALSAFRQQHPNE